MAAKRTVEGVDVEPSSGNVFADLGLPDADKLKIKSGLVINCCHTASVFQSRLGRSRGRVAPVLVPVATQYTAAPAR